ncbi:hypothetical protein BKA81DRAFT_345572 [Phyllosticta paracitricarpa]
MARRPPTTKSGQPPPSRTPILSTLHASPLALWTWIGPAVRPYTKPYSQMPPLESGRTKGPPALR